MPLTKGQSRNYKAFLKRRRAQRAWHKKHGKGSFWDWLLRRNKKDSDG